MVETTPKQQPLFQSRKRFPQSKGLLGRTLLWLAAGIAAISFLGVFLGVPQISAAALSVTALGTIGLFLRKAWTDNRDISLVVPDLRGSLKKAALCWLGFFAVLAPALVAGYFTDRAIDGLVHGSQASITTYIDSHRKKVERVKETRRHWLNPLRYVADPVKREVITEYQTNLLAPAAIAVRVFYSFVYAILRAMQFLSYLSLAYITIRSFVFLFTRVCLLDKATVKFHLPHRSSGS
jgi:hypothetical protein